jgi:transposase
MLVGMAMNFIGCDREQEFLLPPSLRDWLPEGHLAWFVIATVGALDLSVVRGVYREDGQGRPAHDPAMMCALLIYAYAVGERSSRQIERRCREDVAFRVIAANQAPDHVTVNRFRSRHADALAGMFGQILALCARAGMVRAGTIAVDGTKLAANASLGANRTADGLRAEAERILAEAAQVDRAEDERFGQARGDELPVELADPATRAARIRQLLDELEGERAQAEADHAAKLVRYEQHVQRTGRRPPGRRPNATLPDRVKDKLPSKVNVTDPDSRIVSARGALIQGFNAQAAVGEGQVILAARIVCNATDSQQIEPIVRAAEHELAAAGITGRINTVLADTGYWNTAQMTVLAATGIETIIPTRARQPREQRQRRGKQGAHAERIDKLLATDEGHQRYRRRQQIVEPVFAHIKHLRGITRFSRRGHDAVQAEWQLIAATHNLLKLYRHPATA